MGASTGEVRTRASVEPGARLSVLAEAGEYTAELEILVVRHRASGWVREVVRRDEDAPIEAEFDPEEGTVTVYEGRPEFKGLERRGDGERSRLLAFEAQRLRHRVHEKLMRAFLDPAVFSGRVRVSEEPSAAEVRQRSLRES